MLRLHDLTVGQRFTFSDKHRGKVFEVTGRLMTIIEYKDIATGEIRSTHSERKTFRMEVELVTDNRVVELTLHEVELLQHLLHEHYTYMCAMGYPESEKGEVDRLFCKITGSAGRRVVLPEGEPEPPKFPADRKGCVS